MSELRLPVDFERRHDFIQFQRSIEGRLVNVPVAVRPAAASHLAVFIYLRLWVDMAYQSEIHSRPGFLMGEPAFFSGVDGLSMAEAVTLLCEGPFPVLVKEEKGYYCERFAKLNAHLSGKYEPPHLKGARLSALERSRRPIAQSAAHQAMLLPPALYKRADGSPLSSTEINRVLILIKTIDNILRLPARQNSQFTEGLINDAARTMDDFTAEALDAFYRWLTENREHPAVHKSTEKILSDFQNIYAAMNQL